MKAATAKWVQQVVHVFRGGRKSTYEWFLPHFVGTTHVKVTINIQVAAVILLILHPSVGSEAVRHSLLIETLLIL